MCAKQEGNAFCREIVEDNVRTIDLGRDNAAARTGFSWIFQYETRMNATRNTVQVIVQQLNDQAATVHRYLDMCDGEGYTYPFFLVYQPKKSSITS